MINAKSDETQVILDEKAAEYACTQILYIIQKIDDTTAAILTLFTLFGHVKIVYDTAAIIENIDTKFLNVTIPIIA